MTPTQILFIVVAAVTLGSALMVVTTRRMMHAAFWLVLSLLGVAVLFVMLESGFFAVVQVLVYIGAIAILIIFGVMMTRQFMDSKDTQLNPSWWLAATFCLILFGGLVYGLGTWDKFFTTQASVPPGGENLAELGVQLTSVDGFMVPFEIASVMLVAAMIGSIYIAIDRKGGKQ